VLIATLIGVVLLGAVSLAILALGRSTTNELEGARRGLRALHLAQTAISESVIELRIGIAGKQPLPTGLGTQAAPVTTPAGEYWTRITDNADDTFTILASATAGSHPRAIEVVVRSTGGGVFANALFAGNRSEEPGYALKLGGKGKQADEVYGNVYSGGDIAITEDAQIHGTPYAHGSIHGGTGKEGKKQPLPDLAGMNYPATSDFDVAALFAGAVWQAGVDGSRAWQVPEANPAHIFRRNPSDRVRETSSTAREDYFLEDPYEKARSGTGLAGQDANHITLSGSSGEPGPEGTNKVYFIDGNLWLHNKHTLSFKFFNNGGADTRVTFVVRGNIYFSDNLFLQNKNRDGVAFIALQDEHEPDSGNIYFGDPVFGTLAQMEAFMYAEQDFYDNNLSAKDSQSVKVIGNMSAGNQVKINRDFGDNHSKLVVEFDPRIMNGNITMPGIPDTAAEPLAFERVSWREVAAP
jgi:hypothetical protein